MPAQVALSIRIIEEAPPGTAELDSRDCCVAGLHTSSFAQEVLGSHHSHYGGVARHFQACPAALLAVCAAGCPHAPRRSCRLRVPAMPAAPLLQAKIAACALLR